MLGDVNFSSCLYRTTGICSSTLIVHGVIEDINIFKARAPSSLEFRDRHIVAKESTLVSYVPLRTRDGCHRQAKETNFTKQTLMADSETMSKTTQ